MVFNGIIIISKCDLNLQMKHLSFISIALISISCFSLLEKSLDKMENDMEKVINNCQPFCSDYKVGKNEWCDCMYACLNKDRIKWKLYECELDSNN